MASTRIRTEAIDDLPTLLDIFAARNIFPAVEREFNRCTANVIAYSSLDVQGLHCLLCMAAWDATTWHNFDFSEWAGLGSICEAPNVILDIFTRDGRRRSADILCIPALALAQILPNGARAIRTEPICLDIAVISGPGSPAPQISSGHLQHSQSSTQ